MLKVIILGAGSSKDCGLPLGDEVWPDLWDYNYNKRSWRNFFIDIFPQFTIGVKKYPPFELALTLIENHIRNKQNLGNYSYTKLEEIKQLSIDSYIKVFCKQSGKAGLIDHNFSQWYKPFFDSIIEEVREENVIFISLNYDVLIDLVLHDLVYDKKIQDFTYGFNIYNFNSPDEKFRSGGILLLKPHGSINFAQCRNRKCRKRYFLSPLSRINGRKCGNCNKELDYLILPPMFNKSSEDEVFAIIHKKVSEVIANASEILIIGYSLPDYDLDILEAFLRGIVNNQNRLKLKIEIVDKSNDIKACIKSKYNNIFHRIDQKDYHIYGFKKYAENFLPVSRKVTVKN